jgi:hypothetical protein
MEMIRSVLLENGYWSFCTSMSAAANVALAPPLTQSCVERLALFHIQTNFYHLKVTIKIERCASFKTWL